MSNEEEIIAREESDETALSLMKFLTTGQLQALLGRAEARGHEHAAWLLGGEIKRRHLKKRIARKTVQ